MPAPAAVAVLDVRAFDSLGDDSPDATSPFGLALIPPAPLAATLSPPRHSHAIAVLTGDGSRLDTTRCAPAPTSLDPSSPTFGIERIDAYV